MWHMSQKLALARAQLSRLAAAPEDLRQSDPTAITWMYLNGKFVTDNTSKTHSEMVIDKVKSGELGANDVSGISAAALGRSKADGSLVVIWATLPESLGGTYHEAIMAAMSQGLASPNGTITFSNGKSMPMADWSARQATPEPAVKPSSPPPLAMAWAAASCKFAGMEKTIIIRK